MKWALSIIFFLSLYAKATNYYFSSSTGSDAGAGTIGSPFKTLTKLNAIATTLVPGDSVLFKRGDTWNGNNITKVIFQRSGNVSSHIVYAAYGSGINPIFDGFVTVAGWASLGGGVFRSTNAIGSNNNVKMVTIDDRIYGMGRFPNIDAINGGYLGYQFVDAANPANQDTLNSTALSGIPNFNGGEIVIRSIRDRLDRSKVNNQSSSQVFYTPLGTGYPAPLDNYGFFFQNHPTTLDEYGEWYYDTTTNFLRVFFGASVPSGVVVKATIVDTLFTITNRRYLDFINLSFTGINSDVIFVFAGGDININTCKFTDIGETAIRTQNGTDHVTITADTIDFCNNNGIYLPNVNPSNYSVYNSVISHCGIIAGMGQSSGAGNQHYSGLFIEGGNCIVQGNRIDSTGYNAIFYYFGDSILIKNNVLSHFCTVKNDGGAIYTGNNTSPVIVRFGQRITHNIIVDANTANYGLPTGLSRQGGGSQALYFDNWTAQVQADSNTMSNVTKIACHNCANMNIFGNTSYNNWEAGIRTYEDTANGRGFAVNQLIRNVTLKHNIWVARVDSQFVYVTTSQMNDLGQFGTLDSNYYCRPIDEPNGIRTSANPPNGGVIQTSPPSGNVWYSLDAWQALSFGYDAHTKKTAQQITNVNQLFFEYNDTNADKIITFTQPAINVTGTFYAQGSTLTLAPYTSVVYIAGEVAQDPNDFLLFDIMTPNLP